MLKKNQRDLAPLGRRNNVVPGLLEFARENPVEAGLLATSMAPVPVVSDVAGLLGDVTGMVKRPEDRTWANAGLAALGLLPLVPAGGMGMLAGKGAKTADLVQLRKAEDLEKAGGNADDIWRETGWGRGADDEWRFEIDDSDAFLEHPRNIPSGYYRLQHDDLENAYPDRMRSLQQSILNNGGPIRGKYLPSSNTIVARGREGHRSTALHELQHMVQSKEGFGLGGNPKEFVPQTTYTADELTDAAIIDKMMSGRGGMNQLDAMEHFKKVIGREPARKAFSALERVGRGKTLDGARDAARLAEDPMESYRRLAGEVEARNVQKRMDWTPEQRRETPPWATEDVPRDQQIVRRGLLGDGPQMSADLPMDEASRMAQRNAAMPLENGGLGLPPDNTSEMRANALGYDVDAYHATNEAFDEFKPGWRGSTYLAQTPAGAHRGALFGDLDNLNPGSDLGHDRSRKITMPLKVRSKDIAGMSVREDIWRKLPDVIDDEDLIKDVADRVKAMGAKYWDDVYESVLQRDGSFRYYKKDIPEVNYQNMDGRDLFGGMLAGFNTGTDTKSLESAAKKGKSGFLVSDEAGTSIVAGPNMPIRSRFAKFDPKKINSRDLLAGVAGAGLLGVGARAAIPPEDERGLLY